MESQQSQAATASESRIIRALATEEPLSDGGLEKAISSIMSHKKYVRIPGYDLFPAQAWSGFFQEGDARSPSRDEGGQQTRECHQEEPSPCLKHLEALLSPPPLFSQSHLAKELPSILDAIGCTPLVRLSRVGAAAHCACQLLGKCEFLSAGGSTKDRIAKAMLQTAEADGQLARGAFLIEPTSGNTGIGLALVAAVKGYKSVAVMPMKMSAEKHRMMKALGATILRTPTKAAWDDQTSHIAVAIRLQEELQGQEERKPSQNSEQATRTSSPEKPRSRGQVARILDQYRNPANPLAHFFGTGKELLHQAGHKLDMVVICAGTGGSLTGIGKRIKKELPNCVVVGVDPVGSILADPSKPPGKPYVVEGIGYDFVPTVLDREVPDFWVKVNDAESLLCARLLIKLEGMLVGGSAGSALAGTFKAIERLGWTEDGTKRVAMILPDGSRNYTSKFVCDEWMADKGLLKPEALETQHHEYGKLDMRSLELPKLNFISANTPLEEAGWKLLDSEIPVLCVVHPEAATQAQETQCAPKEALVGIVTESGIRKALGEFSRTTPVGDIAETDFPIFDEETLLSRIAQSLELRRFVLISSNGNVTNAVEGSQLLKYLLTNLNSTKEVD